MSLRSRVQIGSYSTPNSQGWLIWDIGDVVNTKHIGGLRINKNFQGEYTVSDVRPYEKDPEVMVYYLKPVLKLIK